MSTHYIIDVLRNKTRFVIAGCIKFNLGWGNLSTLMPVYHSHKPAFRPKMAIFRRAGMREGGLPLPLAFQYLILMIWRACDLNLVMISLLASKCQDFKLRGLKFNFIKQLKNGHLNFKALPFWIPWRYYDQNWITSASCHKNQILKSWWEWQLCLFHSCSLELRHFTS